MSVECSLGCPALCHSSASPMIMFHVEVKVCGVV